MYSRLLKPPARKSFFLFGPRGTGKTTWVRQTFPGALYYDLLDPEIYHDFLANPQHLEIYTQKQSFDWITIDEIQKIPELLNVVHRLIENKHYKFILTGSSARKLRRGGYNLLAGRALTYSLYPLTAIELGSDFDLEKTLEFGSLPSVFSEENKRKYLAGYVKTYLYEEIQAEGMTRNLSAFARFLETASFSQGAVLNMSEVAREAMVERKVIESYFNILEDLLVAVRIPVFTKRAKRKLILHNKFYFFDTGIYRMLRPSGPLDRPEEIAGIALESLFLQNLRAINDYFDLGYKIYFYRTVLGVEVDFVLYGPKGIIAFEVKRSDRITRSDFQGLKTFMKDYPLSRGIMIYGGKRKIYDRGVEIWPADEALKSLPQILNNSKTA
jgi:predicted AAA+ superfamily ATPase